MSTRIRLSSIVTAITLASLASSGCEMMGSSKDTTADASKGPTLYQRLGEEKAITAVVEDFVPRAAANPKVNFFRKGTAREWRPADADVATFKKRLIQFISAATGGPSLYEGKDMKTAHAGMRITNEEFDALAKDLQASLDKLGVPAKEAGELMAIVGTTRKDIVEL
jgi:hemoglobin